MKISLPLWCLFALVSGCGAARAQVELPQIRVPKDRSVFGATTIISTPLGKRVRFNFNPSSVPSLHFSALAVDLPVALGRNWTLTPGYFGLDGPAPALGARRNEENRFRLGLTYADALRPLGLRYSLRGLYERRFRGGTSNDRYRAKLELRRSFGPSPRAVYAYVSDEEFYEQKSGGWTRRWDTIGVGKPLTSTVSVEAIYLSQQFTRGPGDTIIYGLALSYRAK